MADHVELLVRGGGPLGLGSGRRDGLRVIRTGPSSIAASTTLAMHGDLDVAAGWAWLKAFMAKQDPAMARQFNATLLEMASNNMC